MRTSGSFIDIFNAVREHNMEDKDTRPINPVIRRSGDVWMLESSLYDRDEADIEIQYEDFLSYWERDLNESSYTPSESDIENYVAELLEG